MPAAAVAAAEASSAATKTETSPPNWVAAVTDERVEAKNMDENES